MSARAHTHTHTHTRTHTHNSLSRFLTHSLKRTTTNKNNNVKKKKKKIKKRSLTQTGKQTNRQTTETKHFNSNCPDLQFQFWLCTRSLPVTTQSRHELFVPQWRPPCMTAKETEGVPQFWSLFPSTTCSLLFLCSCCIYFIFFLSQSVNKLYCSSFFFFFCTARQALVELEVRAW